MGKRCFDIGVGAILAILAAPVVAVLAFGVALELRTWPLFLQTRIGRHGREFGFLKLRTLPRSTPRYVLKDDLDVATLPPFVRFLRRSHLDELPQLFLVPFGRISLVGPRPKMPDDVEPVDPAYRAARIQVPQGCTGLWQIGRDSQALPHDAPHYDLFYVRYRTLRLDAGVLWRTALLMLGIGKPVSLDHVPRWSLAGTGASTVGATASGQSMLITGSADVAA